MFLQYVAGRTLTDDRLPERQCTVVDPSRVRRPGDFGARLEQCDHDRVIGNEFSNFVCKKNERFVQVKRRAELARERIERKDLVVCALYLVHIIGAMTVFGDQRTRRFVLADLIIQSACGDLFLEFGEIPEKDVDEHWVVLRPGTRMQKMYRLSLCFCRPEWADLTQCIVSVGNGKYSCGERDGFPLQALRIAIAVPKFVMVLYRRNHVVRKADLLEY